jgi:hypothetical protein
MSPFRFLLAARFRIEPPRRRGRAETGIMILLTCESVPPRRGPASQASKGLGGRHEPVQTGVFARRFCTFSAISCPLRRPVDATRIGPLGKAQKTAARQGLTDRGDCREFTTKEDLRRQGLYKLLRFAYSLDGGSASAWVKLSLPVVAAPRNEFWGAALTFLGPACGPTLRRRESGTPCAARPPGILRHARRF